MVAVAVIAVVGCGDGRPAFCGPLSESADLDGLVDALDSGDLDRAAEEADALRQLAGDAPAEVRDDLVTLSDAVVEVVELLGRQADPGADAAETERRRERLNADLAEMSERTDRVQRWTVRECGFDLRG